MEFLIKGHLVIATSIVSLMATLNVVLGNAFQFARNNLLNQIPESLFSSSIFPTNVVYLLLIFNLVHKTSQTFHSYK